MPEGVDPICGNCEHFVFGYIERGKPKELYGDCHNGISGRLRTHRDDRCAAGFFPCTTRWPLRAGPGGVR